MPDPFQDVSAAGDEMIGQIIEALEDRADDPAMTEIIERYFADLTWPEGGTLLAIGCGTGPVARAAARHSPGAQVIGTDPAAELIEAARNRAEAIPNLAFETCDGAAQTQDSASVGTVILHAVLSHVTDPQPLLAEAFRVLRPGGQLVVCDADFSRLSLALCPDDPLEACAIGFSGTSSQIPGWPRACVRSLSRQGSRSRSFARRRDWTSTATAARSGRNSRPSLVADSIIGRAMADSDV